MWSNHRCDYDRRGTTIIRWSGRRPAPVFVGAPAVNSGLTRTPLTSCLSSCSCSRCLLQVKRHLRNKTQRHHRLILQQRRPVTPQPHRTRQMTRLHTRSMSTWFWCAWWFETRNTASISDVLFVGAGDSVKLLRYSGGTAGDVAFNAGITATLINSSDKAKKAHSRRHVTPEQDHSR